MIKHCEAYGFWMALLYKGQELEREIISIVQIVQIGQMCEDNVKWLLLSCRSFIQIKSYFRAVAHTFSWFFSIRVTNYCQMVVPLIDAEFCFLEVICRRICVLLQPVKKLNSVVLHESMWKSEKYHQIKCLIILKMNCKDKEMLESLLILLQFMAGLG